MKEKKKSAVISLRVPQIGERTRSLAFFPLIVLAASIPYLGVLDSPFVFDDIKLVKDNELLRVEGDEAVQRLSAIFDISSTEWKDREIRENYRPLRFLSYYVDYQLSRASHLDFRPDDPPPLFFHLQNLIWHVLNSLLVFVVGRRLLTSTPGAFFLALLFALHPMQTEAVTYVSGRRDVLSTFFFLASLALYLRSDPRRALLPGSVVLCPLLFVCGFLAKEMVITLPAIVLCLDLLRRSRWEWRRIVCHASLWAIALYFVFVTVGNKGLIAEPVGGGTEGTIFTATIFTAARFVMRYFFLLLVPVSQSLDYSYDAIPSSVGLFDPWTTAASLLGVFLMVALAVWGFVRRHAVLAAGLVWFLVTLTPVLQFVPIPERFAERFAYLPSLGIFLLVASLFERALLSERVVTRRFVWLAVLGLCSVLLLATLARNDDWRSKLSIWESAVASQPRSARAHYGYANALREKGHLRDAAAEYTHALELWSRNANPPPIQRGLTLHALMFRGGVYAKLGEKRSEVLPLAIRDLQEVLASTDTDGTVIANSPKYSRIRHELAFALSKDGQSDAAKEHYLKIIAIGQPQSSVARAYYWLGKLHLMEKDLDTALARLRQAVDALPPGDPSLYDVMIELSDLLANLERRPEAAWEVLQKAEDTHPPDGVRIGLLLRMAKILDQMGELESCRDKLYEALAIDSESAPVLKTLAGIEANLGRFDVAEERLRSVLRRDPDDEEALESLKALAVRRKVQGAEKSVEEEQGDTLSALLSRAKKSQKNGEYLAARDVYAQLLKIADAFGATEMVAVAYCGIAANEEVLGRSAAARKALEKAARVLPERAETLRRLAAFHVRHTEDTTPGREYYERYLRALGPDDRADPNAHLTLGYLLEKDDPPGALDHLLKARELGIDEVLGRESFLVDRRLGYIYAGLGEWGKSFDSLQRYLDATKGKEENERQKTMSFLNEKVIPHMIADN